MSICRTCKAEGTRSRIVFSEGGETRDECPNCAPSSFEKFTAPSDKKIWMGYEAHPEQYEKKYDKDGLIYERKPEYRAEQEEQLALGAAEDREREERAIAHKRATRRTLPMDAAEMAQALGKAEEIAAWITASVGEVN